MKHIDIKELFSNSNNYVGKQVVVCGWVRTSRDSKNLSFIELNDGTCLRNIQLILEKDKLKSDDIKSTQPVGTSLCIKGQFIPSQHNEYEINVSEIKVLGNCPQDYPLQKKRHTLEFLRTIPHLRARTRYFEAVLAVRDQLSYAVHSYFHQNGYKYVHAPIITGSDCEGAGEMFRVTTQPWNADYKSEEEYFSNDFFGKKAGLTVSAQLEGEMAAMGLGRIYTFGPPFELKIAIPQGMQRNFGKLSQRCALQRLMTL